MRAAMKDLRLEVLYVVYPGSRRYSLAERIEAVPLSALVAQWTDSTSGGVRGRRG